MGTTTDIASPLRYPGGKSRIATFLVDLIFRNNLEDCTFYELYAGGAGAALGLLYSGAVKKIVLNDLDPHIYSFWSSILHDTDKLLRLVYDTAVDIETWKDQKEVYLNHEEYSPTEVGFSTFYLNRCNRSGILYKAGPIGGMDQSGNYKIDVRFNKEELSRRIQKIANHASKIEIRNEESITLLDKIFEKKLDDIFVFLDPPYYDQGENLYLNFYTHENHTALRDILERGADQNWFLTYDNCDPINNLYSEFRRSDLPMSYTLQRKRKSKEVMIFSNSLHLPKNLRIGSRLSPLILK